MKCWSKTKGGENQPIPTPDLDFVANLLGGTLLGLTSSIGQHFPVLLPPRRFPWEQHVEINRTWEFACSQSEQGTGCALGTHKRRCYSIVLDQFLNITLPHVHMLKCHGPQILGCLQVLEMVQVFC